VHTYDGNPERGRGLDYTDVQVPGEQGLFPAWHVPGKASTWVIMVHGYKSNRAEGLRIMPLFVRLGLPVLDITYRNDLEAPASPDKLYHLGSTEWQDLEAAVQYALTHGAEDLLLYGWSMGGNIVETFLRRSSFASHVRAVVLDAPVLNWRLVFDKQARDRHFPEFITNIVEWIIYLRAGINFNEQDHIASASQQKIPTLLFHGVDDSLIPVAGSDAFARSCPDLVTYQRVSGANHTQGWNVDAQAYEQALETFLAQNVRLDRHEVSEEVLEAPPQKNLVQKITKKKA
jgi:alpha-beta hydrolase superfamily lysophospholipase